MQHIDETHDKPIMTKSELEQLIDRYLQGKITKSEKDKIEQFYTHLIEKDENFERMHMDKIGVKNRIYLSIQHRIERQEKRKMRYILSAIAASLILVVSAYLYISPSGNLNTKDYSIPSERTISAGSDQRSLLLSDGTYVLLSAGSSITYLSEFDEKVRRVELNGEAWFDVQRDTLRPFQVKTGDVVTKVLGTSFSINSSDDKHSVEVKVTSGRVQVHSAHDKIAVLEKDDQLIYQSGEFEVTRKILSKTENHLPKPGAFKLANVTMSEAAEFIEKRWQKKITFENESIEKCPLYASFNAEDDMEEVLMILCGVSNSKYKLENEKIIIYGKGCSQ